MSEIILYVEWRQCYMRYRGKKQRKWVNSKNNNDGLCDNSFVFGIHKRNLTGAIKEGGSNAASLIDRRIF